MDFYTAKTDWRAMALSAVLVFLYCGLVLADLFFAVGWFLRLLEINSVYDRLLPQWSALQLFGAAIAASICTMVLIKTMESSTDRAVKMPDDDQEPARRAVGR